MSAAPPARATTTATATATATVNADAPAVADAVVNLPAAATTGLAQAFAASGGGRVRQAAKKLPPRKGPIWETVSIITNAKAYTTSPELVCKDCGKAFAGGVTRIKAHIVKQCTCSTDALLKLRQKLLTEAVDEEKKRGLKREREDVDAGAESGLEETAPTFNMCNDGESSSQMSGSASQAAGQPSIVQAFKTITKDLMDEKIADFIYGAGLSFTVVESPQFRNLLKAARYSPHNYKPPDRVRMAGDLLEASVKRMKIAELPIREACMTHGCTVTSDGWDDSVSNHYINFLVTTVHGSFFDGTIKLGSNDSEKATAVAKHIGDEIERVGALNVVQVVTDTCAVMKSAWKLIEKQFPWITCTCCASHVLSLLLKDIGKIPAVASVIGKAKKILSRFWGRKRWCRSKLREVAFKNHGKSIGLYRAASTRFAGHVRELGRILRLKADLKYIVDTAEYSQQDFRKKHADVDPDALDGEGGVKDILLDEAGFWTPLVAALKVMVPITKVLRMCDGNRPVMGKVYDRMFTMAQKVSKVNVPWAAEAATLVEQRWEYMHSFMHGAAYALDPEFYANRNDWDEATMNGVMELIERITLRDMIRESPDPMKARRELTANSEAVAERVAAAEVQLSQFRKGLGPFSKQKVLINAKVLEPADWWHQYCKHLPLLSSVAKSVLSQVVSSSAAERNWSIYGRIKSKDRSNMLHSKSDKLVYCHETIHLKNKLQSASYTFAECEKWDTDSDTDASGDSAEAADLMC